MKKTLTFYKLPKLLLFLLLLIFIVTITNNLVALNMVQAKNLDSLESALDKIERNTYVAHRGIVSGKPENSLPAFEVSKEMGFKVVETDIRLTEDGQWILMHDYTVDRTTNGTGDVNVYSAKNLKNLKIVNKDVSSNLSIPTLDEFLYLCKSNSIYPILDLKPADSEMGRKAYNELINSLKKYDLTDKSIVSTSSKAILTTLRRLDKNVTLAVMLNVDKESINLVKKLDNAFIYSNYKVFTADKLQLLKENNIKFGAWTVNNKETAKSLFEKGSIMVVTDTILHEQ